MNGRVRIAVAAVLLSTLGACATEAAILTISGTAPTHGNDGSCPTPVQVPFEPGVSLVVRVSWSGPASGADSTSLPPGASFSFTKQVPPGTYSISAFARNGTLVGCDTTITKVVRAIPGKLSLN